MKDDAASNKFDFPRQVKYLIPDMRTHSTPHYCFIFIAHHSCCCCFKHSFLLWGPSGDVFKSIHRFVCVCTHIFQFAYTASALHHKGHTFAISLLCEKIISTGKQKLKSNRIGEFVAERMKYGTCEIQLSPDLKP